MGTRTESELGSVSSELTGYGGVKVFKVLDVPGALRRSETLIVDFEEVPQSQLHVRHRGTEVFSVICPYCTHKQCLHNTHTHKKTSVISC